MSSILKNNTANPIVYPFGYTLPANGQLTIDPVNKKVFARSNEVNSDLCTGVTTYNDGTSDLQFYEAIWHLNDIFPNIAGIVGAQGDKGDKGDTGDTGAVGAQGIQGVQGAQGIQGETGIQGPAGVGGSGGLEFYKFSKSDSTSTTSNDNYFTQKTLLTTASLDAGTYFIQWYFEYKQSSNWKEPEIEIELDGSTVLGEVDPEQRDDKYYPASGFDEQVLSAGIHNISIKYRASDDDSVSIRRARIAIWKVG